MQKRILAFNAKLDMSQRLMDGHLIRDIIVKAASEAIEEVYHGQAIGPVTFQTKYQPHLLWTLEHVSLKWSKKRKNRFFPAYDLHSSGGLHQCSLVPYKNFQNTFHFSIHH
ncbi:unnamed protein product [Lactuca virosa]|uniref:Uncharacterized protein n=1 Tax=Lactuca virosa TaxID=75947 RepID=A0AAU9NCM4_9ASTR|nr:unnamed protein product [Lactuca virosa]